METDSSYEDRSEFAGEDSSTDDDGVLSRINRIPDTLTTSRSPSPVNRRKRSATKSNGERWERLRKHYNDRYLCVLNETSLDGTDTAKSEFGSTQVGLTEWSASEKEQFFHCLCRRSKADVRGIATGIGSKSELEVYDYLRLLEEEDRNRHLYAEEVNNVSHAEIPAAAEVSNECEQLLEEAADALAIYQDQFDRALGEQTHHGHWLIDHVQARAHDKLIDRAEDGNSSKNGPWDGPPIPAGKLFRLSSWLSLTERVFMNSEPSINAAQEEVPAVTWEAISDLYDLGLHHLRKIMQTSIFCAESRLRNTEQRSYRARAVVREQDVAAAIAVLGLQENWSRFWVKLARRNGLRVVNDDSRKDRGQGKVLKYSEVESILSEVPKRRRGRSSAPAASESLSSSKDSDHVEKTNLSGENEDEDIHTSDQSVERHSLKQGFQPAYHGDAETTTIGFEHGSEDAALSIASLNEGLSISGDDQDRYLEILDRINSRQQELQLYHDLGWAIPEDTSLGHLEELKAQTEVPQMTQRKARPELQDWRDSISRYVEDWEEYGHNFDETDSVEDQRRKKRRTAIQDAGEYHNLPFRATPM